MPDDYARDLHRALFDLFSRVPARERPVPTAASIRMTTIPAELVGHLGMVVECFLCGIAVQWEDWPEHLVWHLSKGGT